MTKNKLFVGNLPSSMSGFSLKDLFSQFGEISESAIISNANTGRSKGFGFLTFVNNLEAKKAQKAMNGKDVEGMNLVVNLVGPEEEEELIKFHHEKRPVYAF